MTTELVEPTPSIAEAALSMPHWCVAMATIVIVGMVVGLHYECLERLNFWLPKWALAPRQRVLGLIISILALHTLEIWIFGIGTYLLIQRQDFGGVSGVAVPKLLDIIYLSSATYTTVGYGDLTPHGPIRFTLGSEALTGFVLVTWSASFTYLEMQRFWKR